MATRDLAAMAAAGLLEPVGENGNIAIETYCQNGRWHREDGPAVIEYDEKGNVVTEEYYLKGQLVSNE